MDNYNLDDILSEIKERKRQRNLDGGDGAPETPVRKKPEIRVPIDPPLSADPPLGDDGGNTAPLPDLSEIRKKAAQRDRNPLDFDGPVQPITQRARQRAEQTPVTQLDFQFDFQPDASPPEPGTETGAFGSGAGDTPSDFSTGAHQATQVVPPLKGADFGSFRPNPDDLGPTSTPLPEIDGAAVDFHEYNSRDDRKDVATDIARVKLWLFIRASVTAVLTVILFWLALSGKYVNIPLPPALFPEPETMRAFLLCCTVLTALVALINSSSVGGGLISLCKMRANSDTLATLAILAAIGQGVAGVLGPERIDPALLALYFPIAALAMLFNALGKMSMIGRIQSNFRVIATDKKKKALFAVNDDDFCREIDPEAIHRPTIAYGVEAGFFTDFLGLSYSDKFDVGINRSVAPVCLAGSIIVAVITYLLNENAVLAISALTAILCISATFSATFVENVPLAKLAKKLVPAGGMVSGNKAVEDFCDTAAVILTENDLFPEDHVQLRGIKTFSQNRIDDAIIDAASVICSLDSALAPVFMQMIGGDRRLLKKVDNVVYENGMGLSAWVDTRRVLIGNRRLMQNHGITMPPEAALEKHGESPEDGELIYLSSSGEAAAQFAVSYHVVPELQEQLEGLAAHEKLLIVHTTDANITKQRVSELYSYPIDLIRVMPAEHHRLYREITAPREKAIAEIVYTGRASSFVAAIIACINARASILSATILQLIQIVLGYGLIAFMAFMGTVGTLTIVQLGIYQMFWFAVIYIVQKVRQS